MTTAAMPVAEIDFAIAFQPMVAAATGLPFAWQAVATTRDGRSFSRAAAQLLPEQRPALEMQRIERVIRAAVAGGLPEGDALLAIPVGAAGGEPGPLLAHLLRIAVAHRLPLERIVVEINADERGDRVRAASLAQACADRCLGISFGGFAAGPLALNLLARFTPRFIRLDGSLVRNIAASASRKLIVEGVLRLARNLDVTLVAGGIGSRADLETLCALGVRHVQGDWIAPPMAGALPPHVARREPRSTVPQHRRLAHRQRVVASLLRPAAPPPWPIARAF